MLQLRLLVAIFLLLFVQYNMALALKNPVTEPGLLTDEEAIEANKAIKVKYYKLTICAKRNPNLTPAQFQNYWSNVHGPKAAKWMIKYGMQQYVQYHTREEDKEKLAAFGIDIVGWDGTAETLTESLEDFVAAFSDPYYINVIAPDEEFLFDKRQGGMAATLGYEEMFVRNGKVLRKPIISKRSV